MRLVALSLVVAVMACAAAPPATSSQDVATVRKQIDSLDALFNRLVAENKADSVVSQYYWPDAVTMNAGAPPARGPQAIRAAYDQFMSMGRVTAHIQATSLVAADSVASDVGQYRLEVRSSADTSKVLMSDHGNYVTTFLRRNGQWRAIYDATMSEVAPPPPAHTASKSKN